jgi:tetratricopeptide (TPR) repeat protein
MSIQAIVAPCPQEPPMPPNPGPFRVPYARNPLFVGREAELARLAEALDAGQPVAVIGTGGQGKTQLAVEAAYRAWEQGAVPGGVFWLNMEEPAGIAAQVAAGAGPDGLNVPGWDPGAFERNLALVQAAWQQPTSRLLVFDNLEDPALLRMWRPKVGGCRVVITARNAHWPAALGVRTLPLEGLARTASRELLLAPRAVEQGVTPAELLADPATAHAADAICAVLGDLPLALALAGAYLESMPGVSLQRYLTQVRGDLLAHRSLNPAPTTDLPTGHTPSLAVTFALSYLRLEPAHAVDALALRLLHRAAHGAPGVPLPRRLLLLAAELDPDDPDAAEQADGALARLVALGLLERLPGGGGRLHRLLAAYGRDRAPDPATDQLMFEAALAFEVHAVNKAGYPLAGLPYLDHLRHAANLAAPRRDPQAATLCNNLASLLLNLGDIAAARAMFERALELNEALSGPAHPDVIYSLNNVALLARTQGDYATAQALLQRALALSESLGDPAHPALVLTLHNLGLLRYSQGDFAAARPLFERVLALHEAEHGPDHPEVALDLNNLANVLNELGEMAEARRRMERSLAIRRRTLGPAHPETAASLSNLAAMARAQGDLGRARPLAEEALALFEQAVGPTHPDTAQSVTNLASLAHDQGDLATARRLHERALAIREQVFGPRHPDTAGSYTSLARVLQAQGEFAPARTLLERAVAVYEEMLGPAHPRTAVGLENLAALLFAQRDHAAARPLMERVLAIREQVFGPRHPDTAGSLSNLAALLHALGDPAGARPLYERALAIQEQAFGPGHPDTANSLNNLAWLLADTGDRAAARPLLARAAAIYEQVYGPDHPATRRAQRNLADLAPPRVAPEPWAAPGSKKWEKSP